MSIIGPRPGLWNQDVLTSERDKYHANDVKPGLTGWAQINGRDILYPEIYGVQAIHLERMNCIRGIWFQILLIMKVMSE